MYNLGNTSNKRLNTCNSDIQLIIREAIKVTQIDFGVAQGERTIEQQQEYYNDGKSKINPSTYITLEALLDKAKHIVDGDIRKKSDAVDIYAYVNGKASWDNRYLCYLGGVITSTASRLFNEELVKTKIRWGGNWDNDGEIITDQSFQDLPHFESISSK